MEKILFEYTDYSKTLTVTEKSVFVTVINGGLVDKRRIEKIEITQSFKNELYEIYFKNLKILNKNVEVKNIFKEIIGGIANG